MKRANIKNELRAFYAKQGLTGKHLRKALQFDMKAVRRNADWVDLRKVKLVEAFNWGQSPEGGRYWCARSTMQLGRTL